MHSGPRGLLCHSPSRLSEAYEAFLDAIVLAPQYSTEFTHIGWLEPFHVDRQYHAQKPAVGLEINAPIYSGVPLRWLDAKPPASSTTQHWTGENHDRDVGFIAGNDGAPGAARRDQTAVRRGLFGLDPDVVAHPTPPQARPVCPFVNSECETPLLGAIQKRSFARTPAMARVLRKPSRTTITPAP